jgi:hypothetical protein
MLRLSTDQANEELDKLLSVHVMAMHSARGSQATRTPTVAASVDDFASLPEGTEAIILSACRLHNIYC